MENNQELNEEMYLEEQEEQKKYSAKKGLKFGIDVLIKLEKVIAIILAALAILEFISGIILFLSNESDTTESATGASCVILGVVLGLYAIFTFYVIKRINSKNYNYNVNDVVFTFFISIPLAVLMIVNKGYDKE
jgi:H+/Cl- antiporter ClcA